MKHRSEQLAVSPTAKVNTLAELDEVFAPVASSKHLAWNGFHLERYIVSDNSATTDTCYTRHVICVPLKGSFKNDFTVKSNRRTEDYHRGEAHLLSANNRFYGHSAKCLDLVQIGFENLRLSRAADCLIIGDASKIELVAQLKLEDVFITDITKYLLAEVVSGGAIGTLYAESLMTALAARIIKNYSTARVLPHNYKGGLTKLALRRALEFIDEHLDENISLSTLAAIADLSEYHFARQFKQSTGFAPHKYVLRQRVERAKRLLLETTLTIAEIAASLGFTDQSHFAKIFRQHTGATPVFFRFNAG